MDIGACCFCAYRNQVNPYFSLEISLNSVINMVLVRDVTLYTPKILREGNFILEFLIVGPPADFFLSYISW